ncbi:hypothetical protein DPEC_G00164180 [Dallia pectoralis]|uniref:Uncharacterized protein n=1 Tax=Dallia pectoralis TaxID=75939 RepID=A0ACC2GHF0_DALPE|nr:hypothetical protein DPEC_G00164180 [Dallia pectoralis]
MNSRSADRGFWMSADELKIKPLRLMAAACNNMGIGKNGQMPWHLPSELKYYMDTTKKVSKPGKFNIMVWGKGTWLANPESMYSLLPNIFHVILSTTMTTVPKHAHYICKDFDSIINLASQPHLCDLVEIIWVLGGPQVYQEAMMHPLCDLIYLTDIMADFDCDVFFPPFDRSLFRKQERFPGVPNTIQEENGVQFRFQVFKREEIETQCT